MAVTRTLYCLIK